MSGKDECADMKEELFRQFASVPITNVSGLVDASGPGGVGSRNELWTLGFTLAAWRIDGGGIQSRPLYVRREVTNDELERLMKQIRSYSVIGIQARVVMSSVFDRPEALLESMTITEVSDSALTALADELQKPVTFDDDELGTFSLDRELDWFRGAVEWDGTAVSLDLDCSEPDEVQRALGTARSLCNNQIRWHPRIMDLAAQELLDLKNECWLEQDESKISADDFKERMTLESSTVESDGSFAFWYDDGDLFFGHSIEVRGNITAGPTDARIHG